MAVTQDIRDAIEQGNVDLAEALIDEVAAKREGKGLSGHDIQLFEAQIARLRLLARSPTVLPAPKKASKAKA